MKILFNSLAEKKDMVKAGNAVLGFKDVIGQPIEMVGAIIYEKDEPNEKNPEVMETKVVSCIKMKDGEFITSISPTVKNSLEMLTSTYSNEELATGVNIVIKSKKSNGGRDFLYIDII